MMQRIKKFVLLLSVFGIMSQAPIAFAACSGSVTRTDCPRCGFLLLNKQTEKEVTRYYTAADGSCRSTTTTTTGSCGSC